jgi:DNA polymerase-3 subunit chi
LLCSAPEPDLVTTVTLHRLAGTKKALEACRLVEKLYLAGTRTVVWIADPGRAGMFDAYLWTFAQPSFVPHALWNGQGTCDDPVVVATGVLGSPNDASALVIVDRLADPSQAAPFAEIHDFVAQGPEDEGKKESWEQAGFTVRERGAGG